MKLSEELNLVTANLRERGWTTGTFESDGKVCAHGAVQTCQGLQPGDEHIIRALMTAQGITFAWNDSEATGIDEVAARISGVDTSDAALADCFGPQWSQIVGVIRTAAGLSDEQATALAAAWDAARDAARDAAWATALAAAWDAARDAAWAAAWDAARYAARYAASDAASDAALALTVRDLIGTEFTQKHYDTLTGPWRTVIGQLHEDDAAVQG